MNPFIKQVDPFYAETEALIDRWHAALMRRLHACWAGEVVTQ